MTILKRINFVLVTLLGITAGIPKIMRMENEVTFFDNAGLGGPTIVVFGILQMIGGILLLLPKARTAAAAFTAIIFLASSVMIFMNGQVGFALVSLLPVLMAGFVCYDTGRRQILKTTDAA